MWDHAQPDTVAYLVETARWCMYGWVGGWLVGWARWGWAR